MVCLYRGAPGWGDRVRMALPERLTEGPETRWNLDDEVDYPSSRGLVLHGTKRHSLAVHLADEALRRHFLDDRGVFVAPGFALHGWRATTAGG